MKPNMKRMRAARIAGCLAALLLLAACSEAVKEIVAQEPDANTVCSLDGMTLVDFPGPKAQIQYAEGKPEFFCDLMEFFSALQAAEQQRGTAALFVQDMGKTDWERPSGNWIDARTALYVVGSKKAGSMGATFGSFSNMRDAQAFSKAEGGMIVRFEQVTTVMLTMDSSSGHGTSLPH